MPDLTPPRLRVDPVCTEDGPGTDDTPGPTSGDAGPVPDVAPTPRRKGRKPATSDGGP